MPEPKTKELKQISSIFLDSYNAEAETAKRLKWLDGKSHDFSEEYKNKFPWKDGLLFNDDNKEVVIQYKEAVWDTQLDKVRRNCVEEVVKQAHSWAGQVGLRGVTIGFNLSGRIPPKNQTNKLAYHLEPMPVGRNR